MSSSVPSGSGVAPKILHEINLRISSDPRNAFVVLDGKALKLRTPCTVRAVSVGRHDLILKFRDLLWAGPVSLSSKDRFIHRKLRSPHFELVEEGSAYGCGTSVIPLEKGGFLISARYGKHKRKPDSSCVLRMDSSGGLVWEKLFSDKTKLFLASSAQGGGDVFIIAGSHKISSNTVPLFLAIDGEGETIWERSLDKHHGLYLSLVKKIDDSSFLLLGHGRRHLVVFKIDCNGRVIWERRINARGTPGNTDLAVLPQGQSMLLLPRELVGLSRDGQVEWRKSLSPGKDFEAVSIAKTGDNSIYILSGARESRTRKLLVSLMKLDSGGDRMWTKDYGTGEPLFISTVEKEKGLAFAWIRNPGTRSAVIVLNRVKYNGGIVWRRVFGSKACSLSCIMPAPDGGFVAVGRKHGHLWVVSLDKRGWVKPPKADMGLKIIWKETPTHRVQLLIRNGLVIQRREFPK